MIEFFSFKIFFLVFAAFLAGLIDSMVGGGGLIQVPALFSAFPNVLPATLFGTNKLSSIGGSLTATFRYLKEVKLPFKPMLMASICALLGSLAGAYTLTKIPPTYVRLLLPLVLFVLLLFTIAKKDMGLQHAPRLNSRSGRFFLTFGIGLIGFYDGFFGPGTGSFFMFLFAHYLGFDFLHSAAATKVVNSVTNFAALVLFIPTGHINWTIGLLMLAFNIIGGRLGSGLAVKNGSQLVRKVFIAVVLTLIIKTAIDAYL